MEVIKMQDEELENGAEENSSPDMDDGLVEDSLPASDDSLPESDNLEEEGEERGPEQPSPPASSPAMEASIPSEQNKNRDLAGSIANFVITFKTMSPILKGFILSLLPYILAVVFIIFVVFFLQFSATEVAERFLMGFVTPDKLSEIKEDLGNFFSGNGFVTDEEQATEAEKKYYEKLEEVYKYYQEKYHVSIDTTLITATLFYDRGMSDYIEDEETEEFEDGITDEEEENIYQDASSFYKMARRHIKTLAKYQMIENTSYNACTDTAQIKITPERDEDVANTWAALYGWNTRATFNYQTYNNVSFPKIDGTERSIRWCEYQETEPQLRSYYQEDYQIYKIYLDSYNACLASREEESDCSAAKALMQSYRSKLQKTWGDVFELSEDGISSNAPFKCSYSDTWGALSSYTGQGFHNYNFDTNWINRDREPNFFENFLASLVTPIHCSAKPSITYRYTTSTEREGVYYYKLLSRNTKFLSNKNFIERYYPDMVDQNDPEQAMEDSIEIVENIFDVYEYLVERQLKSASTACLNGVTVIGEGTFDLEEYVAGVVAHENTLHIGENIENMKAQAVAARTYVLNKTQNCAMPIQNSTSAQTFSRTPDRYSVRAAQETAGEILTDASGNAILAQYDAWAERSCNASTCTIYQKNLQIPRSWVDRYLSASRREYLASHYHGQGMSQYGSFYLSTEQNYSYQQILSFFYSDSQLTNSSYSQSINNGTYTSGQGFTTYPTVTYPNFDGDKLVEWARKYIGNPYVFGGNSLVNGVDCSGFTQQLMKSLFNISIPRTAYEQSRVGARIATLDEAKPGDLLFFNNGSGRAPIDHVAIYAGNGRIVHASSPRVGIIESKVGTRNLVVIRRLGG